MKAYTRVVQVKQTCQNILVCRIKSLYRLGLISEIGSSVYSYNPVIISHPSIYQFISSSLPYKCCITNIGYHTLCSISGCDCTRLRMLTSTDKPVCMVSWETGGSCFKLVYFISTLWKQNRYL